MAEFCSRMRVCPPQMIPGLCFAILLSVTVSSQPGLEEVFFGPRNQTVKEGSLPSSVSPQLRSTSVPPVQPLVTQVHSPMLPPPPYPNLPMELPQHPEPQTDARPTTRASTRPPHTTVTKSSPVRLENSLQRPSNQARTPTAEPAEVRGLVDSGGQNGSRQDQSVASSKEGDEEQRNTSQSPMTSKDPRSRVTPQSPSWLPVLEKHDVPIVVGVGVSLAFIFITVAFYSSCCRASQRCNNTAL